MTTATTVTCHFCGKSLPMDEAIESGWVPSFSYEGDDYETCEPVCCDCASDGVWDDDGLLMPVA